MANFNECKLAYYQANGATSQCVDDAEHEFLIFQGATQANVNDMWFEYLTNALYTGSLSDMRRQFWLEQACYGPIATVPNVVALTLANAIIAIEAVGLEVNIVIGTVDPVISQDPAAGTIVIKGTAVNLIMTS